MIYMTEKKQEKKEKKLAKAGKKIMCGTCGQTYIEKTFMDRLRHINTPYHQKFVEQRYNQNPKLHEKRIEANRRRMKK